MNEEREIMVEGKEPIFSLLLRQLWGKGITEEEAETLNEYKGRSPYHKELVAQFGDIDWINNQLQQLEEVPSELIRQRIKASIKVQDPTFGAKPKEEPVLKANVTSDLVTVHRLWKKAFIVIFFLGKIFLGLLIYYMLKYYKCRGGQ